MLSACLCGPGEGVESRRQGELSACCPAHCLWMPVAFKNGPDESFWLQPRIGKSMNSDTLCSALLGEGQPVFSQEFWS